MSTSLFGIGVVIAAAVLIARALARRLGIPDAVAFVLLGIVASVIPGVPEVRLSADIVLLIFLPPLIFFAGFFSDARMVRANIGTITGLAVALVVVTCVVVAVVLHAIVPALAWAAVLAFGAAVAPPDPVAATSVMDRYGVPRRVVTIIEGEGLINDGISLTLFSLAIEGVGKKITIADGLLRGLEAIGGGLAFGLVVGVLVTKLRTHIRDMGSQIVLSLLTPYLAYIPAEWFHGSGVLATLATAGWLGTKGRGLFQPTSRVQTETFWRTLNFLLEATLFVLLGLQVPALVKGVADYPVGIVVGASFAVVGASIGTRLLWQLVFPPLVAKVRRTDEVATLPLRERMLIGWSGMRGAVSLAIALSIPLTLPNGDPFPGRALLVFLTTVVILTTLVGQGSSLPLVIRKLGVAASAEERAQGLVGRSQAAEAALKEISDLVNDGEISEDAAGAVRPLYEARLDRLRERIDGDGDLPESSEEVHRLRLRLLGKQREAVHRLYSKDQITGDVLQEVSHELDLEEARLRRRD